MLSCISFSCFNYYFNYYYNIIITNLNELTQSCRGQWAKIPPQLCGRMLMLNVAQHLAAIYS